MEAVANKDKEKENSGDDEFDTPGKGKRKRKSGLWSRQVHTESLGGFCAFYLVTLFWGCFDWFFKKNLCVFFQVGRKASSPLQ